MPKRWRVAAEITLTDAETGEVEETTTEDEFDKESEARKKVKDKEKA